jgi:hypothetical protein
VASTKDTALDAKGKNRAFEIASYRYDSLFRPLDQLLVPKEPPKNAKDAKPAAGKAPKPEASSTATP